MASIRSSRIKVSVAQATAALGAMVTCCRNSPRACDVEACPRYMPRSTRSLRAGGVMALESHGDGKREVPVDFYDSKLMKWCSKSSNEISHRYCEVSLVVVDLRWDEYWKGEIAKSLPQFSRSGLGTYPGYERSKKQEFLAYKRSQTLSESDFSILCMPLVSARSSKSLLTTDDHASVHSHNLGNSTTLAIKVKLYHLRCNLIGVPRGMSTWVHWESARASPKIS